MVSNETKNICSQVEKKVKTIVQNAIKAFDDRVEAIDFSVKFFGIAINSGFDIGSFDFIKGGKEELERDARKFTSELKDALKTISEKLELLIKTAADIDDILYFVDKFEYFAKITEPLDYTVKRYSIAVTCCHGYVVDEAKKWREKIDKDPIVRKNILKAQLATNQAELARVQNELENRKKIVVESRNEISNIFNQYNNEVAKILIEAKIKYENLLREIELAQKQLFEKSKIKMEKFELLTRASLFNRKEREEAYIFAKQNCENMRAKLKQLEMDLCNFAKISFAMQYGRIDKSVDDLLLKIEKYNGEIQSNEVAIESYNNAIERIKGELNGK